VEGSMLIWFIESLFSYFAVFSIFETCSFQQFQFQVKDVMINN